MNNWQIVNSHEIVPKKEQNCIIQIWQRSRYCASQCFDEKCSDLMHLHCQKQTYPKRPRVTPAAARTRHRRRNAKRKLQTQLCELKTQL